MFLFVTLFVVVTAFAAPASRPADGVVIYLAGDSTMADYANNYDRGKDYMKTRYPVTGWGQVFQENVDQADLSRVPLLQHATRATVDDRARGGRSTRTFFQDGRWRGIYDSLRPGDVVMMQFGHNDAATTKPERYVDVEGYKEFLRLFVRQTQEKRAIPIVLTPVCRNNPWADGHLQNAHGDYPQAARDVAGELGAYLIDLNQLSMDAFSAKGREYVTEHYYMNLPAGKFEAYPQGQSDNTHFQPEGARAVASLVMDALRMLDTPATRPATRTAGS